MYSQELENLIDLACEDGILTPKERAVLFKRAENEGIDLDEFEMVLDTRLARVQRQLSQQGQPNMPPQQGFQAPPPPPGAIPPVPGSQGNSYPPPGYMQQGAPVPPGYGGYGQPFQQPRAGKYGVVNTCPNCGATVEGGNPSCPECGYFYRGINANSSVERFSAMMQEAQLHIKQRADERKQRAMRKSSILGFLSTYDIIHEDRDQIDILSNVIDNFPVPTTKEDLLEFILFLEPKTHVKFLNSSGSVAYNLSKAYKRKYEECCRKAMVFFPNDPTVMQAIARRR